LGRKGGSTGLKRKPAPRFWPIHRKEFTWVVRPSAGPHSLEHCMPLAVILRDVLGFAQTRREARMIVSQGMIQVDDKVRRKDDFPVGMMDVVSMPEMDIHFRVLPFSKGLMLHRITKEESAMKLCRIEKNRTVREGHASIQLHDGSNLLVEASDTDSSIEDTYKTLDTVKIALPEKQILEKVEMKTKVRALITGGKNIGKQGTIAEIEEAKGKKRRNTLATIEDDDGNTYQTVLDFVFAVGKTRPLISIPEVIRSV